MVKKSDKPVFELIKDSMKKDINEPLTFNNLSLKKTFIGEWKHFFTFLILMLLVWTYFHDTAECRELILNKEEVCSQYQCRASSFDNNFFNDETWKDNKSGIPSFIPPDS